MTATQTVKAVCVWLDSTSEPSSDPVWIVSRDTIEIPEGRALVSHTASTHEDEGEAMQAGRALAQKLGLPLYRNPEDGPAVLVAAA